MPNLLPGNAHTAAPIAPDYRRYSGCDNRDAGRWNLQNQNGQCWFAPEDMKIGDKVRPALDSAVLGHHKLLLALSEHSTAGDWLEQEVGTAFEKERDWGKYVIKRKIHISREDYNENRPEILTCA